MLNVIDLFAGAGGLSLGASRAGFNVIGAVEWDKSAMNTHKKNFPTSHHLQEDITSLTGKVLLKKLNISDQKIAGIIGGPPCQGFSNMGKGDVDDSRNSLFIKFFSLVNEIQPTFFVAENVPGILNPKYKQIRTKAFQELKNYTLLPPLEIKANEYGAPTTRTRIFFIGYKNNELDLNAENFFALKIPNEHQITVREALKGLPQNIAYKKHSSGLIHISKTYYQKYKDSNHFFHSRVTNNIPKNVGDPDTLKQYSNRQITTCSFPTKHSPEVATRYGTLQYGEQDKISKSPKLNPKGLCPTLRAGTGPEKGSYQAVRPIHFKYPRVITPREAARLQGFPDWFIFAPDIWHCFRQIGNSVSPLVAEKILSVIHQKLTL